MFGYILIISFFLSFIPAVREFFKKILSGLYVISGISLIVLSGFFGFYLFPKTVRLLQELDHSDDIRKVTAFIVLSILLSVAMVIFGLFYKGFSKDNKKFYLFFALLIILLIVIPSLAIIPIISSIYTITSRISSF